MSRFLEFDLMTDNMIGVFNKRNMDALGEIVYYKQWKQFVFIPHMDTVFSSDCMKSIMDKVNKCNQAEKLVEQ